MRKIPAPLRSIFRPMKPRSSAIEQGLAVTSILAAMILAAMALVVHHINGSAAEAGKRSIRAVETIGTLDKLQLALRDGDMASRDPTAGRTRERGDAERFDNARFQARLNLTALGPLAGDEPAQAERLSRLAPLVARELALGIRGYVDAAPGLRDDIDRLIATLREDETRQLLAFRTQQDRANERSTWILVGALALVSLLSVAFWTLLKVEFRARRALESRLIESATTDELTGAANRRDFDRKLVQEWTFRQRYATALSLLVVELDQFRRHTEALGAVAGDDILREAARRLRTRLTQNELLARTSEGQFAVLVPRYRRDALALAEMLRARIDEAPFVLRADGHPEPLRVTATIGVAEASDVDSARTLLAAAGAALERAQPRGGNVVEPFRHDTTIGGLRATSASAATTATTAAARETTPITIA